MRDGATLAPPPPSLKRRIWVGVAAAIDLGSLSSMWRWMRESAAENSVLELHSRPRDLANLLVDCWEGAALRSRLRRDPKPLIAMVDFYLGALADSAQTDIR